MTQDADLVHCRAEKEAEAGDWNAVIAADVIGLGFLLM